MNKNKPKMKMTEEHRLYLNDLRRSGATNMFGAGPYLVKQFGLSEREAREVLGEWMRTFDKYEDNR